MSVVSINSPFGCGAVILASTSLIATLLICVGAALTSRASARSTARRLRRDAVRFFGRYHDAARWAFIVKSTRRMGLPAAYARQSALLPAACILILSRRGCLGGDCIGCGGVNMRWGGSYEPRVGPVDGSPPAAGRGSILWALSRRGALGVHR